MLILASAAPLAAGPVQAAAAPAESPLPAEPFSEARLAQLRAAGTPVFVYFTADWCLTCKVNERGALAERGRRRAFPRARHQACWSATGRPATPRSAASSRRRAARACRSTSITRPAGEAEVLPQLLTAGRG